MQNELTAKELELVTDKDFLLAKARIMEKLCALMGTVQAELKLAIEKSSFFFPRDVDIVQGKISKGENYHSLPWIMLDYPKHFSKNDIFAFRTMFLWGSEFSCTLHLQGKYLESYRAALVKSSPAFEQQHDIYICVHETPWEHHFGEDNYVPVNWLSEKDVQDLLDTKTFIKLSRRLELKQWETLPEFAGETLELLLGAANG
jgi:hypothetical protein